MMFNFRPLVFLALIFLSIGSGACQIIEGFEKSSDRIFEIRRKEKRQQVPLRIRIADWHSSCTKKTVIVWGQTLKKMPIGQPPYTEIYILNAATGAIKNSFTTTRGPFDIYFIEDGKKAIVDDYLIDAQTGKILSTAIPATQEISKERCAAS